MASSHAAKNSGNENNMNSRKYLWTFLGFSYLFFPAVFYFIFAQNSFYIVGFHCGLSSIIISVLLFRFFLQRRVKSVSGPSNNLFGSRALFLSFVVLSLADILLGLTALNQDRELSLVFLISDIAYTIFMVFLSSSLVMFWKKLRFSKLDAYLGSIVFVVLMFINYKYILNPFIHKTPAPSTIYQLNSFVYAVLQQFSFALLVPIAFRSTSWIFLIFSQSLLLMFCADFGSRYGASLGNSNAFVYGIFWEIALAVIATSLLSVAVMRKIGDLDLQPKILAKYSSLRCLTSLSVVLILPFLLGIFSFLHLVSVENVFDLADIMMLIVLIMFFSNIISNLIHRNISKVSVCLNDSYLHQDIFAQSISCAHIDIIQVPRNLPEEIADILQKHNALIDFSNSLVKIVYQKTTDSAIAQTTQMVAHDVRRPFALLKSALSILQHANTIEDVKKSMKVITPSLEKAIVSVNGMLGDIMEFGRTEKPMTESNSVVTLLESSLSEVFQIYPNSKVSIRYNLNYAHEVEVDMNKIQRVVSNILGNAIQAMKEQGEIWFIISESDGFVEFRIGNDGPSISADDFAKLFDVFYSKGKKSGTGLGLAIAKKVVKAHGGEIRCQYANEKKHVEFVFTLPASQRNDERKTESLPHSSSDLKIMLANKGAAEILELRSQVVLDPRESHFEQEIIDTCFDLKI